MRNGPVWSLLLHLISIKADPSRWPAFQMLRLHRDVFATGIKVDAPDFQFGAALLILPSSPVFARDAAITILPVFMPLRYHCDDRTALGSRDRPRGGLGSLP